MKPFRKQVTRNFLKTGSKMVDQTVMEKRTVNVKNTISVPT